VVFLAAMGAAPCHERPHPTSLREATFPRLGGGRESRPLQPACATAMIAAARRPERAMQAAEARPTKAQAMSGSV